MRNDGEILKKIRKARNLTQGDLVDGIVSSQTVSAFEKGETEPNYKAFCAMVKNAGATLEEFEYEMNDFELDEFNSVLAESKQLYYEKDILGLEKLLEEEQARVDAPKYIQNFTCLIIKSTIGRINSKFTLNDDEKDEIIKFLYNTNHWGYLELTLFNNTIEIFDSSTLASLSEELLSNSAHYVGIPNNRLFMIITAINAMSRLIYYDEFDTAIKIKEAIEGLVEEDDILYKTLLLSNTGMLELSMGVNIEGAKQKMQDAILVFKLSNSFKLAEIYQNSYDRAVKELGV